MSLKVAVLKGGISSEREVSLRTGAAVEAALIKCGYQVVPVTVDSKEIEFPEGTGIAFICLHGTFGEDGELQAILEARGLPFTGSSAEGCRNAFDKLLAKKLFAGVGVPTPRGDAWNVDKGWPLPCVVKPVADGSSVGVHLIRRPQDWERAKMESLDRNRAMMVEDLIEGREVTVGILNDRALPVVEVRPKDGFFDYTNKYTAGRTEHLCPAPFPEERTAEIQAAALSAHRALGCQVYSRVDVMVPESGPVQVLEVNTIPGMTETSLLPDAARAEGISFEELCRQILEHSLELRS